MHKSKAKPHNSGQWTEARFRSFVMSALRRAQYPVKYEALKRACVGRKVNKQTGRIANHYLCCKCRKHFVGKDVQIDHITPVVPLEGFDGWNGVIGRLYCELDGFQVLCKPCHKIKSDKENEERRSFSRKN